MKRSWTLLTFLVAGTVALMGSSTYSTGSDTFTVNGSGTAIGGTADSFQFSGLTMTGDGTVIARVATRGKEGRTRGRPCIREEGSPGDRQSARRRPCASHRVREREDGRRDAGRVDHRRVPGPGSGGCGPPGTGRDVGEEQAPVASGGRPVTGRVDGIGCMSLRASSCKESTAKAAEGTHPCRL